MAENIAARIREMDEAGRSRAEIAAAVERTENYVGAVLWKNWQRKRSGQKQLHPVRGRPRKNAGDENVAALNRRP